MKPAVQPIDPVEPIRAFLELRLGDKAQAVRKVPSDWRPTKGAIPVVGVFDDGGAAEWPIVTNHRIRITVWSDLRSRSREFAAWVAGLILSTSVPGIAQVRDPSAILEATDSHNNDADMASFTVSVRARTAAVDLSTAP